MGAGSCGSAWAGPSCPSGGGVWRLTEGGTTLSAGGGACLWAPGGLGISAEGGARREKFREAGPPPLLPRPRPGAEVAGGPRLPARPAAMSSGDAESAGREGAPRAAAALCGLYHEAGQRLRRLQDQLAARDALIARLRARLAALEGDTAPSLVDALLEQVARFREQLRQRDGGAAEAALRQVRGGGARLPGGSLGARVPGGCVRPPGVRRAWSAAAEPLCLWVPGGARRERGQGCASSRVPPCVCALCSRAPHPRWV